MLFISVLHVFIYLSICFYTCFEEGIVKGMYTVFEFSYKFFVPPPHSTPPPFNENAIQNNSQHTNKLATGRQPGSFCKNCDGKL